MRECGLQDGVEVREGFDRFFLAAEFDERSDGIEGIEEEVWLHLRLQGAEVSRGELLFELRVLESLLLAGDLGVEGRPGDPSEDVEGDFQAEALEGDGADDPRPDDAEMRPVLDGQVDGECQDLQVDDCDCAGSRQLQGYGFERKIPKTGQPSRKGLL